MALKIAPFTLREPNTCVKCTKHMPVGTVATWLREPERKGYYHPACEALPTNPQLVLVKAPAADSALGYRWVRAGTIGTKGVDTEKPAAGHKTESNKEKGENYVHEATDNKRSGTGEELVRGMEVRGSAAGPADRGHTESTTVNPINILLDTLVQALLPSLTERIAEHVASNQPRIVVQVFVSKPGEEVGVLENVSKALFSLGDVKTI